MFAERSIDNNSLVTIGITAFNASSSIERAIRSALKQTWRPIEVIVVDDCSQDNTHEIVFRLMELHPEISLFQTPQNSGVSVARNLILEKASGEFVTFFDDDDESLVERVALQVQRITDYEKLIGVPDVVMCHSARRLEYDSGLDQLAQTIGLDHRCIPVGMEVAEHILLGKPLKSGSGACPTCSQMARLSSYQKIGGFDPKFRRSEDTELNIRMARIGAHFIGIGVPLVTQIMTQGEDKGLRTELKYFLMMLKKHKDVADQYGLYAFSKDWVKVKYVWMRGKKTAFLVRVLCIAVQHPMRTLQRLRMALKNYNLNKAYGRFHARTQI